MNFYQHQERARRRSVELLLLFMLAVAVIVLAVNGVLYALTVSQDGAQGFAAWLASSPGRWTSACVLALIAAGSAYTSVRLAGGGKALAAMVGARRIDARSMEEGERQLCNVVEEMAIASGSPRPALYVLDGEQAINAFVAGTRPTETVMVVTRGALDAFTRDELQGVVAHEYSHIFHQDMRLNMRLMGMLAGILLISRAGRGLLRAGSNSGEKSGGQAALFGLALLAIGYLGVLLGSLIQAAISRQREFLADASAVQLTRNPDGIAAALYRIGQAGGSRLRSVHAGDLAHFCFGESVKPALAGLLASHPPLADRIAAIAPHFDPAHLRRATHAARVAQLADGGVGSVAASPSAAAVVASAGHFAGAAEATAMHRALPPALLAAARGDAPATLCYALLLAATSAEDHAAALDVIRDREGEACAQHVATLLPAFADLSRGRRLPLLNLALPGLQALSTAERARLCTTVAAVIDVDGHLSFFEFVVQRILEDHLAERAQRAVKVRHFQFAAVADALRTLLSALAWAGDERQVAAEAAFLRGWRPFSLGPAALADKDGVTAGILIPALSELAALSPLLKHNVIGACADCVLEDSRVSAQEAELLQAIALSLDCPLPPLPATLLAS